MTSAVLNSIRRRPDCVAGQALLPITLTINMPSRLKSATVTPEMRVSNVPTDEGLHVPYRLWSTPSPFKQAMRAARFAGDRMSIGARAS